MSFGLGFDEALLTAAQWCSGHGRLIEIGAAALALAAEIWRRRAHPAGRKAWRRAWSTNVLLLGCSLLLGALLAPLLSPSLEAALSGESGLLGVIGLPFVARVVAGLLLLDLINYLLHVALHRWPLLWRLHQVHHSDAAMNASTHFRQHPLQSLLIIAGQLPLLYALGIPAVSWVLLGVLALVVQLWQHAEGTTGRRPDRWLSPVLITPSLHRVHHHPERARHDSNYGNVFSFWDRLCGTLIAAPPEPAAVGLRDWPGDTAAGVVSVLKMPFVAPPATTAAPSAQALVSQRRKRHN